MDAFGVRRRDTTVGPPLRVLSLDGGGVRGYSMLIIVQELMHRTFVEIEGRAPRRHEIPRPCEHFDLIVGTGTGGLIALMLGRLRLDLETCKELYVRLTRMVFETDKTIAGIPYRSTLFKASRLEDAIRQCVREHTASEKEGEDETDMMNPIGAASQRSSMASSGGPRRHMSNASTVSFSARSPTAQAAARPFMSRYGDPNTRLYDARENRTKTVVTAIFKGAPKGDPPVLLRSYDSRHEPPPEFDCKIWQAGRATCAIGLAFKPIQIGQSTFHDDGVGTFNPAPEALDEAVVKEWPGRDVGVFVSVGTGRRPKSSDANQHQWYEGFLGEFAEARRRLIAKIEGCEKIHEFMLREYLTKRGVNVENYYRLNVEIGVGEFGMNEWNRLGEISTSTRRYMAKEDEQRMVRGISTKLAKIQRARQRLQSRIDSGGVPSIVKSNSVDAPMAVELPGDTPDWVSLASGPHQTPPSPRSYDSGRPDSLIFNGQQPNISNHNSYQHPASPDNYQDHEQQLRPPSGVSSQTSPQSQHASLVSPQGEEPDRLLVTAPTPAQYRNASGSDKIAITSADEQSRHQPQPPPAPPVPAHPPPPQPNRVEPPPLPPKTPLPENHLDAPRRSGGPTPPYPEDDEAPPPVNMARKPDYRTR